MQVGVSPALANGQEGSVKVHKDPFVLTQEAARPTSSPPPAPTRLTLHTLSPLTLLSWAPWTQGGH